MSYMTLMQTFVVLTLNELIYLSTKYYIICTKFIHTLGCHDQYCFINYIHQYVSRRFFKNLKCTVIHFKIIKNTKKQVDSVYLHAQFSSS